MKVCWISAGVSSFVAGWLVRETVDEYIYIDIDDQHPDSMRFIKDCEKALGKTITILKSNYNCVNDVCRQFRFITSPYGAKCTDVLKKRVRKEWEYAHKGIPLIYVWGMNNTEKHRADRLVDTMTDVDHEFPLIDRNLDKQAAHAICESLGIKRPAMYDLGYSNNNCIGCVKGGKGYWNKIRVDFPEVFESRAKMEREIGHSILNGCFLDELAPDAGRMNDEIMTDCDIFCMLALSEDKNNDPSTGD